MKTADIEIRLLVGCDECGRRVSDGKNTIPGTVLAPPADDRESDDRVPLCSECHQKWVMRLIFPNGFAV